MHQPAAKAARRSARSTWSGVDPGEQGGGLGTRADPRGPRHLRALGLAEVMLYVDEDNTAAVRMYTALGFSRWSTDVMYRHA